MWVCSDDQYHHHGPFADDVRSGPPPPHTPAWPGGRSTRKSGGRRGRGARWSSNERRGGGGSVGEVDDWLPVGGDEEVVLRLGDLASKSICRSTLALPSECGRAYMLLGRRSLSLGGEEGCGKGVVGRSDPGRKGLLARSGGSGPLGIPEEEGDT